VLIPPMSGTTTFHSFIRGSSPGRLMKYIDSHSLQQRSTVDLVAGLDVPALVAPAATNAGSRCHKCW